MQRDRRLRLFGAAPVLRFPAWETDRRDRLASDEIHGQRLAALKASYPAMFGADSSVTGLPPGWMRLFERLCDKIDRRLSDEDRARFRWTQVKEKLGGFRAYFAGGPIHIDFINMGERLLLPVRSSEGLSPEAVRAAKRLIRAAERVSVRVCQFCGAPGKLSTGGPTYSTACAPCERQNGTCGLLVWLDDERAEPANWVRARTAAEAIEFLRSGRVHAMSLDHDLGDDAAGTGYDVLTWLERETAINGFTPPELRIHTANPAARPRMEAAVESIGRLFELRIP